MTLICLLVFVSVSGLSGNVATARSQVSVSGLSGTCTVVGKCDIRDTFDALMPCTKDGVGNVFLIFVLFSR